MKKVLCVHGTFNYKITIADDYLAIGCTLLMFCLFTMIVLEISNQRQQWSSLKSILKHENCIYVLS